jgi:hypothetical protein
MDLHRLEEEIKLLQQDYRIKWDLNKNYVMLINFDYPDGWEPRRAPLFFSLHDAYPRVPPLVYLPPEMTYRNSRPIHQHTRNRDGWWQWCIDRWNWRPHQDTLIRATETMRLSLAKPSMRNVVTNDRGGLISQIFG